MLRFLGYCQEQQHWKQDQWGMVSLVAGREWGEEIWIVGAVRMPWTYYTKEFKFFWDHIAERASANTTQLVPMWQS
jgi:hypothetical protein